MDTGKQFNNRIKQVGMIIFIIFLLCLIIGELRYFISSLLGGFTLFMILRKPHRKLIRRGWHKALATSTLLIGTFVVLSLIIGSLLSLVYLKLQTFDIQVLTDGLRHIQEFIIEKWGYNIFSEGTVQKAFAAVGNILPAIVSTTGNVVTNVILMMFVLFFMLQQSEEFEATMESLIPVSKENVTLLKKEAHNIIINNAVGIPLIMLGQGLTAGLGYWLFGAGDPVIWGLMTGIFGLIPIGGTLCIWLSLAINLIAGGNIWQGMGLIVYGLCIISNVDYVFRVVFMKKQANMHPLITIFGIFLGMNLFGFWGIIFGPLALSGFFLLIKIYKNEFSVE
jgi:predicted PurR-regulated permease PerM